VSAIKHFFSSDIHNYKFFGHTWNHSFFNKEHRFESQHPNFKLKNQLMNVRNKQVTQRWHDNYDNQNLHDLLINAFGMTDLLVEDKKIISDICSSLDLINPTYVAKKSGAKTDFRDVIHLANELRCGHLKEVLHDIPIGRS
jgi:hypothetical protein